MSFPGIERQAENIGDFIDLGNPRLRDIEMHHTNGAEIRKDGFNSILGGEKISETIDSSKTSFPPYILLVPPKLLGTHEETDPPNPEAIEKGYEIEGFKDIDFEKGWDGPAIAVVAYTDCKENNIQENGDGIYKKIVKRLTSFRSKIGLLEKLSYGDLLIADGHHRLAKAKHAGLKFVPVQIIPYPYDPSVILDTWHADGKVLTAEEVFRSAKDPTSHVEAKRTKFGIIGTDGVTRRILSAQPKLKIALKNLT